MSSKKYLEHVDPSEFSARLKKAVEAKGLNQTTFAEVLNLTQGQVSSWFTGRHAPTKVTRSMLALVLGVSRQWLETGAGDIHKTSSFEITVRERPMEYGLKEDDVKLLLELKRVLPHMEPVGKELLRDVIRRLKQMAGVS